MRFLQMVFVIAKELVPMIVTIDKLPGRIDLAIEFCQGQKVQG